MFISAPTDPTTVEELIFNAQDASCFAKCTLHWGRTFIFACGCCTLVCAVCRSGDLSERQVHCYEDAGDNVSLAKPTKCFGLSYTRSSGWFTKSVFCSAFTIALIRSGIVSHAAAMSSLLYGAVLHHLTTKH